MKRRNSFAPHLPKPALLPLLVLLALPPCTSKAGFLQEFYDDAGLQSSYTAPGLYASASMDTVTGGRFILKTNREDFQPYYLQGPELKAGCGGIDVFLGAFSIPSKDEFVSFVRSIGTALPGLAFHAALQSLAPDLNEQISQFRDMLMRYASMLGDSCQVAENIMNAGPSEWISTLGHKARNSLRSLGQAEDAHDADSLTRADGGKVVSSAPTRTDTGGNIVEASELNLTWALLISGKGSQRLTQEKREVMMSLIGTRVFVKKGSGTSTTIEERNYPALDLLNAVLGEPGSDKIPTEAVVYKCDEKDKCLNPTRTIYSDVNLNNQIYKAMTNYRSSLVYRDVSYVLARSSLDTAMQVRALGWGFRKTAAQLYCPNTLESCMLGYFEVKSTKRFDDWYASLRDKIAKKAVDRRIARVAAGLFGDVNRVGKISELRIDVGPGYRVYFTTVNGEIIFLLAGGDKRTQQADIDTATRLAENLEL